MEYIQKEFKGIVKDKYRFTILFCIILLVFIPVLAFTMQWTAGLLILIPVAGLLIYKSFRYHKEMTEMNHFLAGIHPGQDPKMVDNTVFIDKNIYSCFMGQYYTLSYNDIISVSHTGNIFEKARPPYRGNHTVSIKSVHEQETITLRTFDGKKADKILCYLKTVNPEIKLFGLESTFSPVTLDQLENWKVKERF